MSIRCPNCGLINNDTAGRCAACRRDFSAPAAGEAWLEIPERRDQPHVATCSTNLNGESFHEGEPPRQHGTPVPTIPWKVLRSWPVIVTLFLVTWVGGWIRHSHDLEANAWATYRRIEKLNAERVEEAKVHGHSPLA
jgi:hypothetical protein